MEDFTAALFVLAWLLVIWFCHSVGRIAKALERIADDLKRK